MKTLSLNITCTDVLLRRGSPSFTSGEVLYITSKINGQEYERKVPFPLWGLQYHFRNIIKVRIEYDETLGASYDSMEPVIGIHEFDCLQSISMVPNGDIWQVEIVP